MNRLEVALEDCLNRIQVGNESPENCLALYPDLREELEPLLIAALKLRSLRQLVPNQGFKSRTRSLLLSQMQANPRQSVWRTKPAMRYAASLAAVLLLFVSTGTALAQRALPGDTLYRWKLASESIWRTLQNDAVSADLILGRRRIEELKTLSGMPTLQQQAINGYEALLTRIGESVAEHPEEALEITEELLLQKDQLREIFETSGLEELPDLDDLFRLITPDKDAGEGSSEQETPTPNSLLPITPIPLPKKNDEDEGSNLDDSEDGSLLNDLSNLLGMQQQS